MTSEAKNTMISETSQYMTFKLGGELFAINVAQVREVLEVAQITKVPTAPQYMRGVVNVRGQATPVVDLRLKFGLPESPDTVHTRIIVMELDLDGEATVLGGIADSVHEVIELEPGARASADTEGDILRFCEEHLPKYKRPRKIIFDEVPRSPTGKIEKVKLRQKYSG